MSLIVPDPPTGIPLTADPPPAPVPVAPDPVVPVPPPPPEVDGTFIVCAVTVFTCPRIVSCVGV